jgi:hypothetical protein
VFISSYIKRWLEKYYDELMTWPIFGKVKGLAPSAKYVIEAGLFALTGYVSTKLDTHNPLTVTLVEVFKDAMPEITSRLIADVRGDLSADRVSGASSSQSVVGKLLSLDDASLLSLLTWLEHADASSREAFSVFARNHEGKDLKRFAELTVAQRGMLLSVNVGTKTSGFQTGKQFLKVFGGLVAAGAKKGAGLSLEVVKRYTACVVWIFKLCMVLWTLGILCWQAGTLSARHESTLAIMLGLTAGCGGMIWWGRRRKCGWLKWAGIIGGSIIAMLTLFTATGHEKAVPGLSFMCLLGFPSVAILVALMPLNAVLALFKVVMPTTSATVTKVAQMVVVAFMGIIVFSVFLFLVPTNNNPVAICILAPLAIVLTLAAGLRLIHVDTDRFFGWPMKVSLVFILLACFGALFIPRLKEFLIVSPVAVTYTSGKDIPFTDKKGHSMIWYAETNEGGFDLFTAKSEGLYTPDGRKLIPADAEKVRQSIRIWVDQVSAKSASDYAARLTAEKESLRQQADEALKEQERNRIENDNARRASYIGTLPVLKVNYAVCSAHESGVPIPELSTMIVKKLRERGKTASQTILSRDFANGALSSFMAGRGAEDLKAMGLSNIVEHLVLIVGSNEQINESKLFANLLNTSGTMTVAVIDAVDGRKVQEYTITDGIGSGVNDAAAWAAFYEWFTDELLKLDL